MRRAGKADGFTLIEVLAALVVFSISIIALTQAGTQSVRSAAAIELKSLAGVVANNQLVEARALDLKRETQTGQSEQMGMVFDYSLITKETEQDGLYRLTITVKRENDPQILVTRTAFRVEK